MIGHLFWRADWHNSAGRKLPVKRSYTKFVRSLAVEPFLEMAGLQMADVRFEPPTHHYLT